MNIIYFKKSRQISWYNIRKVRPLHAGLSYQQGGLIWDFDSSIVKDLIDSEDPKHTLFCHDIAFVAIYAIFRDTISIP